MLLKIAFNVKVPSSFTDMGSLICSLVENYSEGQTDDIKLFWPKNFLIKILFWWRDVKKKIRMSFFELGTKKIFFLKWNPIFERMKKKGEDEEKAKRKTFCGEKKLSQRSTSSSFQSFTLQQFKNGFGRLNLDDDLNFWSSTVYKNWFHNRARFCLSWYTYLDCLVK